jgi:flagellar basal-body rod modification protein FlgD
MHVANALSLISRDSTTATSGSTSSSPSSTTALNNDLSTNSFMILLSAELQNQDPTQPVDPTEFVSQLAQLSELQSVTQIQQSVSQLVSLLTPSQSSGTSS